VAPMWSGRVKQSVVDPLRRAPTGVCAIQVEPWIGAISKNIIISDSYLKTNGAWAPLIEIEAMAAQRSPIPPLTVRFAPESLAASASSAMARARWARRLGFTRCSMRLRFSSRRFASGAPSLGCSMARVSTSPRMSIASGAGVSPTIANGQCAVFCRRPVNQFTKSSSGPS
jgi:hypothetical protein